MLLRQRLLKELGVSRQRLLRDLLPFEGQAQLGHEDPVLLFHGRTNSPFARHPHATSQWSFSPAAGEVGANGAAEG